MRCQLHNIHGVSSRPTQKRASSGFAYLHDPATDRDPDGPMLVVVRVDAKITTNPTIPKPTTWHANGVRMSTHRRWSLKQVKQKPGASWTNEHLRSTHQCRNNYNQDAIHYKVVCTSTNSVGHDGAVLMCWCHMWKWATTRVWMKVWQMHANLETQIRDTWSIHHTPSPYFTHELL